MGSDVGKSARFLKNTIQCSVAERKAVTLASAVVCPCRSTSRKPWISKAFFLSQSVHVCRCLTASERRTWAGIWASSSAESYNGKDKRATFCAQGHQSESPRLLRRRQQSLFPDRAERR